MKIAQVSQHYLPIIGGQEVYIDNLNRVFREGGHDVEVFQPDRGVRREDIVPVFRIPGAGRFIPEPYLFNFFLGLAHMRRLAQADLLIAHYAFSAWPLGDFAKRTIILSHGIEWHLDNQRWDDRTHERVARSCLDRFPHVVNDTHYLRHFGYPVEPARGFFTEVAPGKWFIPNCVDTTRFQRTPGLPELAAPRLLVPRQVVADRGIDLAIRAFKLLSDDHSEFLLHVLGKIRRGAYFQMCVDLARRLGLEKRVIFQDHIENGQMSDYYSSALLTLIPTLRREGTSLSALESMACGTATVSTNVAGLRDLPTVQSDPNDEALARAIRETLARREVIGASQRDAIRQTFNFENWGAAWLRVVKAVAERN